jgi:hypothetical protein
MLWVTNAQHDFQSLGELDEWRYLEVSSPLEDPKDSDAIATAFPRI